MLCKVAERRPFLWPMSKHTHNSGLARPLKRDILQRAHETCGTLSQPSKMPCFGFSLPAQRCQVGGKLQSVKNSTCFKCYALKGNYLRGNVRNALELRYSKLMQAQASGKLDQWAEQMAAQINACEKSGFFRWHDSGDIQSAAHLLAIFKACELTPHIKHWLPTRELKHTREALAARKKPSNLTIRLSALKREFPPSAAVAEKLGVQTSTVSWTDSGATCGANKNGGECGECRACWAPSVANVDYPLH